MDKPDHYSIKGDSCMKEAKKLLKGIRLVSKVLFLVIFYQVKQKEPNKLFNYTNKLQPIIS